MLLILDKILWLLSILFSISLLNTILHLVGIHSISFMLFIALIALLTIIIKLGLNKYIYTDFSNDAQFNNNSNIEDGIVNNINDESSNINEIDDIDSINKTNFI